MGGDIHNISVLTANLFLSCRDSHSNSCQKAIKRNGLFPVFPVYKPNWTGAWHSSSGSGLWGGMLPRNKGPGLAGAHVTEQWEHLHSRGSTLKLLQVKKSSCRRLQSRSDVETQLLACRAPRWSESYQLMSSWSFLPGEFRWMPPLVHHRNHLRCISECQCINICRRGHVWSLRAEQLIIFLPLLFFTIRGYKHAIHLRCSIY